MCPRFKVKLTRIITQRATVVVAADSPEDAEQQVDDKLYEDQDAYDGETEWSEGEVDGIDVDYGEAEEVS